ncbi:predicted protein [Histoplasma mississippiense (nom. inval.)]|uniref:predicted protein n=1 Tax=Ajellomyces capsulatus (strain NAm1 / WU24) TaxID=2059318 RepID=UPI000157D021|nr:predicted protein [Histoplasma mississippiense (nom. inval.)]EDN11218.1 predicted protein [Histoplasma mississippiense (nom. inval.)]
MPTIGTHPSARRNYSGGYSFPESYPASVTMYPWLALRPERRYKLHSPYLICGAQQADPIFSAWGLYGKDDQLGFLNRQTDAIVAEAAKEIETGDR